MATIPQILSLFWQDSEWTMQEDDYGTLQWFPGNAVEKPSESAIRARSSEADAAISLAERRNRQQRAMNDAPDHLLTAIEILIDGLVEVRRVVNDIRSTTLPAAHTGDFTAWDAQIVSRIAALRQKVANLRNIN